MSLIRNERSSTNKTLTAKRFVAGEPLSGDSYRPIEYIQVGSGYIGETRKWVLVNSVSSFIIKAEFYQGASGTLIGRADGLQIVKDGSYIKWKNSGTDLYQVAWKEGMQLYGFVRRGAQTLPYYEGEVITSASPAGEFPTMPMMLGIATDSNGDVAGNPISSTTWGFRVSEVIGDLLYSDGSTSKQMTFHWYATRRTAGYTPIMFETRSDSDILNLGCFTAQGRYYTAGEDVTYGMQVDDLEIVFGSPYQDLLMILTGDGGVDMATGWRQAGMTDPYNLNKAVDAEVITEDNVQHKTAFYLPDEILDVGVVTFEPQGDWSGGDLFRGRKPKWNLWNNAIKAFKYIKSVSGGFKLAFNIFSDVYGRSILAYEEEDVLKADHLLVFDGYNNSNEANHAPFIELNGTPAMVEFFGDVPYSLDDKRKCGDDEYAYYYDTITPNSVAKICLGNMPWWNLTAAELAPDLGEEYLFYNVLRIFGVCAHIDVRKNNSWQLLSLVVDLTPIKDSQDNPIPFCSQYINSGDTDIEAARKAYQEDGVDAQLQFINDVQNLRFAENGAFDGRIVMGMARTSGGITESNYKSASVDCSDLVAPKLISIKVYKYTTPLRLMGDRYVIGSDVYAGVVNMYHTGLNNKLGIYVNDHSNKNTEQFFSVRQSAQNTYDGWGFGFRFSLATLDQENPAELLFEYDQSTEEAVLDSDGFHKPKFLVYARYVVVMGWQAMLGILDESKLYVGKYEDFKDVRATKTHYVDASTGEVYRKSGNSFIKDAETEVTTLPTTDISRHTTYILTDESNYHVPCRYSEDGHWIYLPKWYKEGVMIDKVFGWAQPFNRVDVNDTDYTNYLNKHYDDTTYNYYKGAPDGNPRSVRVEWNYNQASKPEQANERINAEVVFYLDHFAHSTQHVPHQYPNVNGTYQPSVVRYQIYKEGEAPHSSGPYNVGYVVDFVDKVENYVFYQNMNKSGFKYVVVGDNVLSTSSSEIVTAYLRLYDGSNNELTQNNFKPFKLTIYEQLPCRPYSKASSQGQGAVFDYNQRTTQLVSEIQISGLGQSYTKNGYTAIITRPDYTGYQLQGYYPELAGEGKTMTHNPRCFVLTVTTNGTPKRGAQYLYYISNIAGGD